MSTGLPVGTSSLTTSTSRLYMRTQPWLTALPISDGPVGAVDRDRPAQRPVGQFGWKALRPSASTP